MKPRIQRRFEPVSDFEIEAYLCGDLSGVERARVEQTIAADAALLAYVAERKAARASFVQRHPLRLPAAAESRSSWRRGGSLLLSTAGGFRSWGLRVAFPLLAAAALGLILWRPQERTQHAAIDTVRVKGQTSLQAHLAVKRGEHVWAHRTEVRLRAGDQLMLAVDTDGPGYITLLGRDALGHVSVYYDALQTSGGRFVAPGSLTLDNQAGDELWLVVFSAQRVAADEYAKKLAATELSELTRSVFRIQKETR